MTPANLRNPITAAENIYWTPDPIFFGETVFCLASGPSLTAEQCQKIRGRRCIAVNSSGKLAPWADVLYFTDNGWYDSNRAFVQQWPGLIVSMSRLAKREMTVRVKRVKGLGQPTVPPRAFPPLGSTEILQGRSSGHTAISLAISMGAARVAMLGYDMHLVQGREHFHDEYKGPRDLTLYEKEFIPAFAGWRAAAEARGVDIVNCTPGSAVTEFRKETLESLLA